MKTLLADTGYWIALLNPKDDLHRRAREISASLGSARIVTSQMILAELLNDFAGRGEKPRMAAKHLVEQINVSPRVFVVSQTAEQFGAAMVLYGERCDKSWSLTDCASYLIMTSLSIKEALTYDKHFEQMGFTALLRDETLG